MDALNPEKLGVPNWFVHLILRIKEVSSVLFSFYNSTKKMYLSTFFYISFLYKKHSLVIFLTFSKPNCSRIVTSKSLTANEHISVI